MLGTVIIATFIAQLIFMVPYGLALNDPLISICGGICAAPFVFSLLYLRRPKLVHLQRAKPDELGTNVHRLPMGGALQTPTKTSFYHHLIRCKSKCRQQLPVLREKVLRLLSALRILALESLRNHLLQNHI